MKGLNGNKNDLDELSKKINDIATEINSEDIESVTC